VLIDADDLKYTVLLVDDNVAVVNSNEASGGSSALQRSP